MTQTLKAGSLFTGIGGFDLGCEQAGFETAWQCEIDKDCRDVLSRHWPNVPRSPDVRTLRGGEVEPVDLVTFGSPCQDVSVAGQRTGLAGERSGLFFEAVRVIEEMRDVTGGQYPSLAVLENVPGLLSSHRGRDFAAVLAALGQCGALAIGWRIMDSQWFGLAQRRKRVFLVADFGGRRAAEILSLAESLRGHPAPRRTAGEEVAGSLGAGSADSRRGWRGDLDTMGAYVIPFDTTQVTSPGNYSNPRAGDPCHPLAPTAHVPAVVVALAVRRLMPVEAERLQGFPDGWTALGGSGKQMSNSARYRMVGNAVSVPVVAWLARAMRAGLEQEMPS